MSKLADDLERLCCAETEGKFFDLVTDNIQTIIAALRAVAETDADAPGDATRAEAMTRPIETAPRDGTSFIAIATAKGWSATKIARFLHADDRLPVPDGGGMWPSPPTHWAPLPVVTSIPESDGPPSCADSGDIIAPPAKIPGPSDTTLSAEGMREAVQPSTATRPATSGTAASGTELGGEG